MHPVAVGGCFGWLHAPPGGVAADVAVLLCQGLRDDGLNAHSQFRQLAETVAQAGYPCLRFDYPGTGDSCDPAEDADLWAAWVQSIHAAADWLRDATGAQRLVLCGLRLGATLAASAAVLRTDVAGLMLLAPTIRGRSFIRQLEVEARLAGKAPEAGLTLHGAPLSAATIRAIRAVELQRTPPPPGCAAAIFGQAPSPVLDGCALAWTEGGATVEQAGFAGLDTLLRNRIMSHEPPADFSRMVGWLRRVVPASPVGCAALPATPVLIHAGCEETPLRFGPDCGLFGMLCRPKGRETDRVVLILNTGGEPRYGSDRRGVEIARRFADAGIASLRMDFAGLGDSTAAGGAQTHVFETDRRAEVSAALDALTGHGFRWFAVHGLCSGAYHAFHAAVADSRIDTVLLTNLPTFEWRAGTGIEFFHPTVTRQGPLSMLRKLANPRVWRHLLRGEMNVRNRLLAQDWRITRTAVWLWRRVGFGSLASPAQVAAAALGQRARTLLLMSPMEAGLSVLAAEFGPSRTPPGGTLHVVPGFDHSMLDPQMRRVVIAMMIEFLGAGGTQRPAG